MQHLDIPEALTLEPDAPAEEEHFYSLPSTFFATASLPSVIPKVHEDGSRGGTVMFIQEVFDVTKRIWYRFNRDHAQKADFYYKNLKGKKSEFLPLILWNDVRRLREKISETKKDSLEAPSSLSSHERRTAPVTPDHKFFSPTGAPRLSKNRIGGSATHRLALGSSSTFSSLRQRRALGPSEHIAKFNEHRVLVERLYDCLHFIQDCIDSLMATPKQLQDSSVIPWETLLLQLRELGISNDLKTAISLFLTSDPTTGSVPLASMLSCDKGWRLLLNVFSIFPKTSLLPFVKHITCHMRLLVDCTFRYTQPQMFFTLKHFDEHTTVGGKKYKERWGSLKSLLDNSRDIKNSVCMLVNRSLRDLQSEEAFQREMHSRIAGSDSSSSNPVYIPDVMRSGADGKSVLEKVWDNINDIVSRLDGDTAYQYVVFMMDTWTQYDFLTILSNYHSANVFCSIVAKVCDKWNDLNKKYMIFQQMSATIMPQMQQLAWMEQQLAYMDSHGLSVPMPGAQPQMSATIMPQMQQLAWMEQQLAYMDSHGLSVPMPGAQPVPVSDTDKAKYRETFQQHQKQHMELRTMIEAEKAFFSKEENDLPKISSDLQILVNQLLYVIDFAVLFSKVGVVSTGTSDLGLPTPHYIIQLLTSIISTIPFLGTSLHQMIKLSSVDGTCFLTDPEMKAHEDTMDFLKELQRIVTEQSKAQAQAQALARSQGQAPSGIPPQGHP
ncbi:hypothetical protein ADUPG1_013761 [Aduncisulcus paluster]|uniref:Uncharacterized protein n=1 Tax=Aduncisulcus paluster TaxID=2918883 RepID=A0ABQ5K414_9EUKA|nr:hypothetical protein ADUPG1_013761 [Aduncisulcus paluster]